MENINSVDDSGETKFYNNPSLDVSKGKELDQYGTGGRTGRCRTESSGG